MMFSLPDLPYNMEALAPHVSKETLEFHHGKHHAGYVTKLNNAIEGTDYAGKSLEEIVVASREKNDMGVFNNAAQHWNHSFYWNSLTGESSFDSNSSLGQAIEKKWGSLDAFKEAFNGKAAGNFGSGWTWLVKTASGDLDIVNTSNAENTLGTDNTALLTCDVWEHAYYIDHRNARPAYLKGFWEITNWDFAQKNFG
ncbi:superoxide dismutase [bacterium]|nr:superoxide dismutase [bacterium]